MLLKYSDGSYVFMALKASTIFFLGRARNSRRRNKSSHLMQCSLTAELQIILKRLNKYFMSNEARSDEKEERWKFISKSNWKLSRCTSEYQMTFLVLCELEKLTCNDVIKNQAQGTEQNSFTILLSTLLRGSFVL